MFLFGNTPYVLKSSSCIDICMEEKQLNIFNFTKFFLFLEPTS